MQEFKAKAKTTQHITHNGIVETNKATGEQTRKSQKETDDFSGGTTGSMTEKALNRAAAEKQSHKANKHRRKAKLTVQQAKKTAGNKIPRLKFSEEERADQELAEHIKKTEEAADRLEAAKAKIPKQLRIKAAKHFDEETGRAKTRLSFEKADKMPNGKLYRNPAGQPIREEIGRAHV